MSTRIYSTLVLLALTACSRHEASDEKAAKPVNTATASARSDDRIECGDAGSPLARACTVEREQTERGLVLTLRHPDGAFRRLLVTRDGRGVVAADGAEPARVRVVDSGRIEVSLGTARYILPATVKAGAR